jgi:hypothetical protein
MTGAKKHPHLEEVARTIAADLKCEPDVAMDYAVKGVAGTARAAGLEVSKNPTADEVEQILAKHWQRIETFTAQIQAKAKAAQKDSKQASAPKKDSGVAPKRPVPRPRPKPGR